ncbi:hypothetical protein Anas_07214 [Armadillidium nasatum]|uniref:Uncharacterized protein n=1 Tax=Armadillidium nasatum TaxID=96803 RepID=A0A5N5T1I8_9CRUS|nr:hypothetical protein Anas_07214 [Armadillidium nasatum]
MRFRNRCTEILVHIQELLENVDSETERVVIEKYQQIHDFPILYVCSDKLVYLVNTIVMDASFPERVLWGFYVIDRNGTTFEHKEDVPDFTTQGGGIRRISSKENLTLDQPKP